MRTHVKPKKASQISMTKPRNEDEPQGEAECDNGHRFKIANYNQVKCSDNVYRIRITGFCFKCMNSVNVIRDTPPPNAQRDYRILTRVDEGEK